VNRLISVALLTALFLAAPLLAQQQNTIVTLTISDSEGGRITNARALIDPSPGPNPQELSTDARGQLTLSLKPASYVAFVRAPGFVATTTHFVISGSIPNETVAVVLQIANLGGVQVSSSWPERDDVLEISSPSQNRHVTLTVADFEALPHVKVTVHNVHTEADETYAGVPLITLLAKLNGPIGRELNGMDFAGYIIATAIDRYVAVLSTAEIDPTIHAGQVLIADSMNGKPLDTQNGPFKLIVTDDKRPARWVRNLVSLEVRSVR